ncbi:heat shock 70 kDa protein 12A-like, partial [Ruditapes philippinarum]|uniref:heat shock 70 kDa protein 12A-like n=1 Tax=Ruditapes philippinarum TaxID=129788 RepID=UPI00295A641D
MPKESSKQQNEMSQFVASTWKIHHAYVQHSEDSGYCDVATQSWIYTLQRITADDTYHGFVQQNRDEMFVVAIEVGNEWSGYVFALRHAIEKGDLRMYLPGISFGDPYLGSIKSRSVVLFDENKKFHSFGFFAEEKYAELVDKLKHNKWYFFTNFMMRLSRKDITRNTEIEDDKGRKMKAIDVIGSAIKYIKDYLLNKLEQTTDISNEDIHWVLSVPAIWTDPAKQLMEDAAYK